MSRNSNPHDAFDAYRVALESGGRANAKAPTSSATGLHQFTNGTWLDTIAKARPAWADGLSRDKLLSLRTDPQKSTEMARFLDGENAAALSRAGASLSAHNLYAAHHFGAGRGARFAKAGDSTPMEEILTKRQLDANPYLKGKTKGEAVASWDARATRAGAPAPAGVIAIGSGDQPTAVAGAGRTRNGPLQAIGRVVESVIPAAHAESVPDLSKMSDDELRAMYQRARSAEGGQPQGRQQAPEPAAPVGEEGIAAPAVRGSGPSPAEQTPVQAQPGQAGQQPAGGSGLMNFAKDAARGSGVLLRGLAGGVASLPAMAADGLIAAPANMVMAQLGSDFRFPRQAEAFNNTMTAAGVPLPQNATERVAMDVAHGLGSAATMIGTGGVLARAADASTKAIGQQLAAGKRMQAISAAMGSLASGVTRELGGGAGAQTIAGLVGGVAPTMVPYAVKAGAQRIIAGGEAGRQKIADNVKAFESVGATPTLGQATGNRLHQGLESTLAKTPGSAGRMAKVSEQQATKMGGTLDDMTNRLVQSGDTDPSIIGESIKAGYEGFQARMKAEQTQLYDALDELIPPMSMVPMEKTKAAFAGMNKRLAKMPNTTESIKNPKIFDLGESILKDTPDGLIPYESLKEIRTHIGKQVGKSEMASGAGKDEWASLYAALSDDLRGAAESVGPDAMKRWKAANTFTKEMIDKFDKLKHIMGRNTPEEIFDAATGAVNRGPTRIERVFEVLPKETQREVAGAILQDMGRATAGQQNALGNAFSSETFLTNLVKMNPRARRVVFESIDMPNINDQIKNLGLVAEARRIGGKTFANPSGTAAAAGQIAATGGAAGALFSGSPRVLVAATGIPLITNAAARFMTNPKLAKALARGVKPHAAAPAVALNTAAIAHGARDKPQPPVEQPSATANQAPSDAAAPAIDLTTLSDQELIDLYRKTKAAEPQESAGQQPAEPQPAPAEAVPQEPVSAAPAVPDPVAASPASDGQPAAPELSKIESSPLSRQQVTPVEAGAPSELPQASAVPPDAAAIAPEPVGDLQAQIAAVRDPSSGKNVALVTPSNSTDGLDLSGLHTVQTPRGLIVTSDPTKAEIARFLADDLSDDQVGRLLGYGSTKAQSDGTVVQAKDAAGQVVSGEATAQADVDGAVARATDMAPAGGSVEVTDVDQALQRRGEQVAAEQITAPAAAEAEPAYSAISDDDLLNPAGAPFRSLFSARRRARLSGGGYEPLEVGDGEYVLRARPQGEDEQIAYRLG